MSKRIITLGTVKATHLVLVLAIALAVRLGFLLWNLSGWYFIPQNTLSHVYFQQGYAISAGYGYVISDSARGDAILNDLYRDVSAGKLRVLRENAAPLLQSDVRPDVSHPPGTSMLIAAIYRIFGIPADVPLQVIAIVLDSFSAALFCWIVTATFGVRMGLVAGLLYALFPPFAAAAVSKQPDGMLSFFLTAPLACVIKATDEREPMQLFWSVCAGICLGFGGYLRPDYILLAVVLMFGLWAYTGRFWRSVRTAAVIQVVTLLVLLPWAYRNYNVCGRWIFTSTMVGAVLITGLGEFQNPWGFGAFDEDRTAEAKAQGISSAWQCEGDLYLRRAFLNSVLERPTGYLATVLKRLPIVLATPFTFGFQNPWKTQTFSQAREAGDDRYQVLLRRPGYLFAAYWDYIAMSSLTLFCFIAILFTAIKERSQAGLIFLLISPHLYSIGTHMLTHMEPRFLLSSMFCWLIGPAYVLSRYSNIAVATRV